jgi:hypothetical protein
MIKMDDKINPPKNALIFIGEMKDLRDKYWDSSQLEHLMALLIEDLENKSTLESQHYLEQIFFSIPPKLFPFLLDSLTQIAFDETGRKIIIYLLRTDRPIYQIKALQMIIDRKTDNFAPYIIPLIFSSYEPLKKQAIKTIIKVPGSAVLILEQILTDRSKKRQLLAVKILKRIAPKNHKLALKLLHSDDFIDRITGIEHLTNSKDEKWLKTIENFLRDPDIAVQKAAIEAIGKLGGKRAAEILMKQRAIQDFPPLQRIIDFHIEKIKKMPPS